MSQLFFVKRVTFHDIQVPILCQNENGPCPLLAIANVLLLSGRTTIHEDKSALNLEELQELVAHEVLINAGQARSDVETVAFQVLTCLHGAF